MRVVGPVAGFGAWLQRARGGDAHPSSCGKWSGRAHSQVSTCRPSSALPKSAQTFRARQSSTCKKITKSHTQCGSLFTGSEGLLSSGTKNGQLKKQSLSTSLSPLHVSRSFRLFPPLLILQNVIGQTWRRWSAGKSTN